MKNRILLWIGAVFVMTGIFAVGLSRAANANEISLTAVREQVEIVGTAEFQHRSQILPMVTANGVIQPNWVCEDGAVCPRTQTYWVFVVHQDGIDFEFDLILEPGSRKPPEHVEIDGMIIRPGTRLAMNAMIEKVTPSLALVTEVQSLSIRMD